ncbi:hypothetical protein ACWD4J_11905 [Streptomyces sp. NPDC002577]
MHELLAVTGLAAAAFCLAGHLPGPMRGWGPHAAAAGVMLLMVLPSGRSHQVLLAGAAAVAAASVWRVCTGCPGHGRASEAVDLAAMALLTGVSAGTGMSMAHHHPDSATSGLGLLVAACWALTRAGGVLFAQLRGRVAEARADDAGALVMVAVMTAMAL